MKGYKETRKIMVVSGSRDQNPRKKMMEGEENVRTVECLRGRLLAERVASKSAKEDAEFMENKLIELEKQLRLEIEMKKKVEKKLKLLMKKMGSLKLSSPLLQDKSSSTNDSDLNEPKEQNSGLSTSRSISNNDSDCGLSDSDHQISSITRSSTSMGSVGTTHFRNNVEDPSIQEEPNKIEESEKNDLRRNSIDEKEINGEKNLDDYVDNTLALVPADLWPKSEETREPAQIKNEKNVYEVLAALRHAREQLQNSIGRKDVICS